jgi:psp operon transcriptional activator
MLRVVEYGRFDRVGGGEVAVDVRIIAATNVDLPALAATGQFRADLLDRLSFEVVTVPPLRERPGDILDLAQHFALAMTREMGAEYFGGFTASAEAGLLAYPWPGNVRELRNVVERSVFRAPSPTKPIADIVFDPFAGPWRPPAALSPLAPLPPAMIPAAPAPAGGTDFTECVRVFEAELLATALARNQYHQRRTAADLGLGYDQLRRHLKKHGL